MIQVYKETVRGDNADWSFVITMNGVPYDITGCSFLACAKKRLTDTDAQAVVSQNSLLVTINDAPNGVIDVKIDNSVVDQVPPGHYYIDVNMEAPTGEVVTPIRIMWELMADVLRFR